LIETFFAPKVSYKGIGQSSIFFESMYLICKMRRIFWVLVLLMFHWILLEKTEG